MLPGLWLADVFPDEEWDALGPEDATHPQYHLKLLLDRVGVARAEVKRWRWSGRAASSPARARAVANAMAAPHFSHKWEKLPPTQRRIAQQQPAGVADAVNRYDFIPLIGKRAADIVPYLTNPERHMLARVGRIPVATGGMM